MKTYLAYFLFLSFAFRPAYNIGYVAYFELNIDYIVETYCVNKKKPELKCNGKCHLASQLALNDTDLKSDASYLSLISDAFFPVFFQDCNTNFKALNQVSFIKNNWCYTRFLPSVYKECINPPPQNFC